MYICIFILLNLRNSTSWMLLSPSTTSHYVDSVGSRDVTVSPTQRVLTSKYAVTKSYLAIVRYTTKDKRCGDVCADVLSISDPPTPPNGLLSDSLVKSGLYPTVTLYGSIELRPVTQGRLKTLRTDIQPTPA